MQGFLIGRVMDISSLVITMALKVYFPSLASDFSSSHGCAAFTSQSLYSATVFTDGISFNGLVNGHFVVQGELWTEMCWWLEFVNCHVGVLTLETLETHYVNPESWRHIFVAVWILKRRWAPLKIGTVLVGSNSVWMCLTRDSHKPYNTKGAIHDLLRSRTIRAHRRALA